MTESCAFAAADARLSALPRARLFGRVAAVRGTMIRISGLGRAACIGAQLSLARGDDPVPAEITAIDADMVQAMALSDPAGLSTGARAELIDDGARLFPCDAWRGRIIDAMGRPVDGLGPLLQGLRPRAIRADPLPAAARDRMGGRCATGVRAIDLFAPLCRGQRLGLFAGSGVGKSVLMSMAARWTACDLVVIGLIGERGREVREFVEDTLGPDGLARAVVVVATSDAPAPMRRQAAWTTMAVAEHFRDQGLHVLCVMDSVTRFAMAEREIGLANGEPPASKGYTPGVFAELPRLLERAGPGQGGGAITALFTVLVDGGDHDEPIADAVRGILDGHVLLDRRIAERGRFPAIDVLKSLSRSLPRALPDALNALRLEALRTLSLADEMRELAQLGAYQAGSDAGVDRALRLAPAIDALLAQGPEARGAGDADFAALAAALEQ